MKQAQTVHKTAETERNSKDIKDPQKCMQKNIFCANIHFKVRGQKAYCDRYTNILVNTDSCTFLNKQSLCYRIF